MKKSFSARRVPRKIGADDADADEGLAGAESSCMCFQAGSALSALTTNASPSTRLIRDHVASALKRPNSLLKKSSHIRRLATGTSDDDSADPGVRTPKKSGLSRIAIQRSAGQRSSFQANELPSADGSSEDARPTYSAADLQALKDSTPATPSEFENAPTSDGLALQLNDKFGSRLSRYGQSSAIPSAAEIAEKKARRARLAMEEKADEYISIDPDDPGLEEDEDGNIMKDMDGRLVLREKDRYGIQESRLVREDEDIMEGFDEFTGETGSRIHMGNSARGHDQQARKDEILRQIAQVEDDSDMGDNDVDEKARNAAFEAAQTRHGAFNTDQTKKQDKYAAYRAKTPPFMTPIPPFEAVVKRFRASITDLEARKREKEAQMLQLTQEKLKLKDEEERVQRQLKEVAEKFRQIKIEKGLLPPDEEPNQPLPKDETMPLEQQKHGTDATLNGNTADDEPEERPALGLESGATGLGWSSAGGAEGVDEAPRTAAGLGSGVTGLAWMPASNQ